MLLYCLRNTSAKKQDPKDLMQLIRRFFEKDTSAESYQKIGAESFWASSQKHLLLQRSFQAFLYFRWRLFWDEEQ